MLLSRDVLLRSPIASVPWILSLASLSLSFTYWACAPSSLWFRCFGNASRLHGGVSASASHPVCIPLILFRYRSSVFLSASLSLSLSCLLLLLLKRFYHTQGALCHHSPSTTTQPHPKKQRELSGGGGGWWGRRHAKEQSSSSLCHTREATTGPSPLPIFSLRRRV